MISRRTVESTFLNLPRVSRRAQSVSPVPRVDPLKGVGVVSSCGTAQIVAMDLMDSGKTLVRPVGMVNASNVVLRNVDCNRERWYDLLITPIDNLDRRCFAHAARHSLNPYYDPSPARQSLGCNSQERQWMCIPQDTLKKELLLGVHLQRTVVHDPHAAASCMN